MSRGWREIVLAVGAYGAYLVVRRAALARGREHAGANSRRVLALERRLRVDVESRVQGAATRATWLAHGLSAGYAAGNVALSVGWLLRLHHAGDPAYARERRAALVAFAGALPVFLVFPVAPPRAIGHVADTLRERGIDLEHPLLVRFYNPVAAMPSHHVAFAVVSGAGLAGRTRSRRGRLAWRAYAPLVALVVVASGNHFTLDVAAGAALGVAARALTR